MEGVTELDLVLKFRDAKIKKQEAEKALDLAEQEYDKTEFELIELLTAKNATKTAEYDGIGHVTLLKPRVFASVDKENQDRLFKYLSNDMQRSDLIKEVVNPQSLSGFVKDELEAGRGVPDFIKYFMKVSLKMYSKES